MEEPDPYGPFCWCRSSCGPTVEFSHHVTGRGRAPTALELDREESAGPAQPSSVATRAVTTTPSVIAYQ